MIWEAIPVTRKDDHSFWNEKNCILEIDIDKMICFQNDKH